MFQMFSLTSILLKATINVIDHVIGSMYPPH